MKRFIAAIALFTVAINAVDGSGDSNTDSVSSWWNKRQEPLAFPSIDKFNARPCMLDGTYGWFDQGDGVS